MKPASVEFEVSERMVENFARLTGDTSSLHMSAPFGRRSAYRQRVAHGMLPLLFISKLDLCPRHGSHFFKNISARFIRPVMIGDRLVLTSGLSGRGPDDFDFQIQNAGTGALVISGLFSICHEENALSIFAKPRPGPTGQTSLVSPSLTESVLTFEQIQKGDQKTFEFDSGRLESESLGRLLSEGLASPAQKPSPWEAGLDPRTLCISSLFSTFTGMCLPGKYATFLDFQVEFDRIVDPKALYLFKGTVDFKSESTRTISMKTEIGNARDPLSKLASGKITAKVGDPPAKMPSAKSLQQDQADLNLQGKVVLVTGSSRGIGETIAKLFAIHKAKVVINHSQSREDAETVRKEILAEGGHAETVQADITDRPQVKKMVSDILARHGRIDVLVNNAVRSATPIPFLELSWEEMQLDMDVALKGAFHCCQEVLPSMAAAKSGKIINISTVFAEYPPPGQCKYVVAKSALLGLTRSLAVEFAASNIQVNLVVSSLVETDLSKHVPKIFLEKMRNQTPMNRHATPAEVAKAVIFLASSLSSFTTGQKIMVTGGNAPLL